MDRYLADAGWEAQQTDEPVTGSPPDNVDRPVEVDVAAHGAFDAEATGSSPLLWLDLHRGTVAGAVVAALGAAALLGRRRG
jgi:hypothetical protein